MHNRRRKTIIIHVSSISTLFALSVLVWFFFPTVLKVISPTRYVHYSFARTGEILSAEASAINDFFRLPDLSDSDIKQLSADLNNMTIDLSYGHRDIVSINMNNHNIGVDLLHDIDAKQASLDFTTGWNGEVFLLSMFADMNQVALGLDDRISWVVNTSTFGKDLSRIGLPIDEDMDLDLGFIFPDVISKDTKEEVATIIEDFIKSLNFRKNNEVDNLTEFSGVIMTTALEGPDFKTFLNEITDCLYGQNERGIELKRSIMQLNNESHDLTVFICNAHIIRAVQLDISTGVDTILSVSIQLADEQNLLDHIVFDLIIQNAYDMHSYHINSKGKHVSTEQGFYNVTTITGFDTGTIQLTTELSNNGELYIETQIDDTKVLAVGSFNTTEESLDITLSTVEISIPFGYVRLSGDLDFAYGKASSTVHNITHNAYYLSDFDIYHFSLLFQVIWDILKQDQTLMEMFGQPFINFTLDYVLGEQLGAQIIDIFGERTTDIMDIIVHLFSRNKPVTGSDLLAELIGNLYGDLFSDTSESILNALVGDILPDGLTETIDDFLGDGIQSTFLNLIESLIVNR